MSQVKMLVKLKRKRTKNPKNILISTKLITHRTLLMV